MKNCRAIRTVQDGGYHSGDRIKRARTCPPAGDFQSHMIWTLEFVWMSGSLLSQQDRDGSATAGAMIATQVFRFRIADYPVPCTSGGARDHGSGGQSMPHVREHGAAFLADGFPMRADRVAADIGGDDE